MPVSDITQKQYETELFPSSKREKALEHALDIRKFEIELYWKRATYFWTFIGATFAGFVAIQASEVANKQDLSVILSCLGFVFSVAWVCVNRGSKQWQENWENHVDSLEDDVTGPLYKVVLTRRDPKGFCEYGTHLLTGPSPLSASKINQLISLYISTLWFCLLIYSLPRFDINTEFNILYTSVVTLSFLSCVLFFWQGRTYSGGFWHKGTIRTSEIKND